MIISLFILLFIVPTLTYIAGHGFGRYKGHEEGYDDGYNSGKEYGHNDGWNERGIHEYKLRQARRDAQSGRFKRVGK